MLPVEQPFKTYTDLDGHPVDNGYVYFGQPNQNPITSPVTVYWDAAGTQPAAQPLRTENGYIVRSGTPANVFYNSAYSELVQDKQGRQVFYARTSDDFSIAALLRSGLLADLAASDGSSLIGFIQTSVGAVARTVQGKLSDTLCLYDFMTAAQITDVKAGTLTLDCYAALNSAIAAAVALKMPLDLGSGRISISNSIALPSNLRMFGRGMGAGNSAALTDIVPINNTFPALIGATANLADLRDVHLSDFRVTGGQNCIRLAITGTMSGCSFKRLWLSTPAQDTFYVAQMLISSKFEEVVFDSTPATYAGLKVAAANTNNVLLDHCWWIESDGLSVDIQGGGESITWINPRFEARNTAGATGGTVVRLANVKAWQFLGGYVEDTYVNFLTETSSTGTGVIKGVRFSGAETDVGTPGLKANTFTSDGIVTLDNCQLNVASNAPAQVMCLGNNPGLKLENSAVWAFKNDAKIVCKTKAVSVSSGVAKDLFTFSRANTNDADNQQSLGGTLTVTVEGKTSGGTKSYMLQQIPILIDGFANATMTMTLGTVIATVDNAVGATLAVAAKAGATSTDITVQATFTLASFGDARMTAEINVVPVKSPSYNHITVAAVAS